MQEYQVEFHRIGASLIEEKDFRLITPEFWRAETSGGSLTLGRQYWGAWQFCEIVPIGKIISGNLESDLERLSSFLDERYERLLDFQEETRVGALAYILLILADQPIPQELIQDFKREAKAQRFKMDCWFIEERKVLKPNKKANKMFVDESWIERSLANPAHDTIDLIDIQRRVEDKEEINLGGKRPYLTYLFLTINIIIFILMTIAGGSTDSQVLITFGAKYNPLIVEGEYWRFITPMFLHIGIFHLLFNSYALYNLGPGIEGVFGRWRFLAIYLLSGIMGSLASFLFSPSISAGASGAIFGLLGAFLYFGYKKPKIFARGLGGGIIAALVINLLYGFTTTGIDNFAHLGGLFGGLLLATLVGLDRRVEKTGSKNRNKVLAGSLILLMGLTLGIYYSIIIKEDSWEIYAHRGEKAMESENYSLAVDHLEKAVSLRPELISLRLSLAYSYLKLGQVTEGRQELETVLEVNQEIPAVYFNLALIAEEENNITKAIEYYQKVLELDPSQKAAEERIRVLEEH